ncbi:MAG TPA: GDSL-type esterase/lipase family protein [Chitinophagaceae bacterium]
MVKKNLPEKGYAFLSVLAFCALLSGCTPVKSSDGAGGALPARQTGVAVMPASMLQPTGRYLVNDQQRLELVSSAVYAGFTFGGEECQVFASASRAGGHNYLQYELDGVYQKRVRLDGDTPKAITIRAPRGGQHTVWLYKATEAHTGAVVIEKITGQNIKALPRPQKPLIEFIGNSITCGAAADPSEVPCGTGDYHDQHNAYYAYGPRVARALGTDFILSSVSGIGIYRNWNSDGPTMPQVYEKLDFQANNPRRWDFTQYNPKVVSIALGTNDFSNGDGKRPRQPFDSAVFTSQYIAFVKAVRAKYPAARIALLSSPMVQGERSALLQNILVAVKNDIDPLYPASQPVALYFFKPMQARGCTGHPNVEDHAILAAELEPFFRGLLQ